MKKSTFALLGIGAVCIVAVGLYAVENMSSSTPAKSSFSTQSVTSTSICPALTETMLGSKNITFSDGTDLSSLFGIDEKYMIIDFSEEWCGPCKDKAKEINNSTQWKSILGDGYDCGFVTITPTAGLQARKQKPDVVGFVADHSKGYGVSSSSTMSALGIQSYAIPTMAIMNRAGSIVKYKIGGLSLDEVIPYCTMCPIPTCGNNTVEGTEQCDDGNTTNGDGCSATCETEKIEEPKKVYCDVDRDGFFAKTSVHTDNTSGFPYAQLQSDGLYFYCTEDFCSIGVSCQENKGNDCNDQNEKIHACPPICGNNIIEAPEQCDGSGCAKGQTCAPAGSKASCTCQYDVIKEVISTPPTRGEVNMDR